MPTSASPLPFVENVGQFAEGAHFQLHGPNGNTLWLTNDGLWLTLRETEPPRKRDPIAFAATSTPAEPGAVTSTAQPRRTGSNAVNLRPKFEGANPTPRIEPFNRLDAKVSHLAGNDPAKWRPTVPVWGAVRYRDLYPGVDLELTSEAGGWTWKLVGNGSREELANALATARLQVEGAVAARVDGDQVRLTTDVGDVALPLVRVEGDVALAALPAAERAGAAGFAVARPFTTSASPAPPGFHPMSGAADLRYGTFLGGSDLDAGYALTVHAAGYVYVAGATKSADFPTTPGAFDTALSGTSAAFVAKLDLTNNRLAYAICIGGGSTDVAEAIAVDATGNVYVAGLTASSDFPTTPSVFDDTHNGSNDAFVVKLNAYGSALHYATYLGGSSLDQGQSIAVDAAGKAYVVGSAASSNFPTTMGAYDTSYNGGGDIFVVEFATGTYRVYLPVVTR